MRTKNFMLTVIAAIAAISVSAQSVEMNSLSTPKSKRGGKLETGYVGTIEVGGSLGVSLGYCAGPAFDLSMTHGYAVSPIFTIGAGATFRYNYDDDGHGGVFSIPAFLNLRIYFIRYGKVRPFLDLRAGYEFPLNKYTYDSKYSYDGYSNNAQNITKVTNTIEANKGLYAEPSLGIRIVNRLDFSAGVSRRRIMCNETVFTETASPYNLSYKSDWDLTISLRLGIRF